MQPRLRIVGPPGPLETAMLLRRLTSDRGELNALKVLLLLLVAGIGYVGYARGGIWLQHQDLKASVRTGANRAYARRNPVVVKEAILEGLKELSPENEDIAVDGSIIKRPLELTDENIFIEISDVPTSHVTVRINYERSWVWPFTKKVGRAKYVYEHTEDLSAIKF